jgi:hypothetical protein
MTKPRLFDRVRDRIHTRHYSLVLTTLEVERWLGLDIRKRPTAGEMDSGKIIMSLTRASGVKRAAVGSH